MGRLKPAHLSDQGAEFVAGFEGFVGHLYDVFDVAHIGYGHKLHDGPFTAQDVYDWGGPPAGHITQAFALSLLREDALTAERAIRREAPKARLGQHQFDALVSFVYNLGETAFAESRIPDLLDLGSRSYHAATELMLEFDHVDGEVVPGLLKRRKAEVHLFRTGHYS